MLSGLVDLLYFLFRSSLDGGYILTVLSLLFGHADGIPFGLYRVLVSYDIAYVFCRDCVQGLGLARSQCLCGLAGFVDEKTFRNVRYPPL